MYMIIFCNTPRCMTEKAMQAIGEVHGWYVIDKGTYIRIFGPTKDSHLFPKIILNKLSLQEVAYQTFLHGIGASLSHDKKTLQPLFPFHVEDYGFKYVKKAVAEDESLITFHFGEEMFRRHDPMDSQPPLLCM
jgi:hypothetical protein